MHPDDSTLSPCRGLFVGSKHLKQGLGALTLLLCVHGYSNARQVQEETQQTYHQLDN